MRATQSKPSIPRIAIRRGDGLHLAIATAGLLATLVAVFFTASYTLRSFAESSAAKAVQTRKNVEAKARADVQARRVGTIVVDAERGGCEELRFDNFTGAFISIAAVDCDARLTASVIATTTQRDASAGMRGMLDSFKK